MLSIVLQMFAKIPPVLGTVHNIIGCYVQFYYLHVVLRLLKLLYFNLLVIIIVVLFFFRSIIFNFNRFYYVTKVSIV